MCISVIVHMFILAQITYWWIHLLTYLIAQILFILRL